MIPIGKAPCDGAAILHGRDAAPCSASEKRWTLVTAILGSSMAFVDGTVVNVALPAMQRELGATASEAQWVVESYALLLAALLLVGGALGDRFGRRLIFMLGVAIFTAASAACAASTTPAALIAARAVQGIGAALLVPGSLALISATYPADERGAAIGSWSAFSGIAAAIGPVLGGYLVEHYRWIWAFLVNLPIGAVLLLLCARKVPERRAQGPAAPLDPAGAVLATLGLGGVVFTLTEGPVRGWAALEVAAAGVLGLAALLAFIAVEARQAAPMLPLSLFRSRSFAGANLVTLLLYAALGGGLYFLPLNLIQVQGYGAAAAGAALLPFIAVMFALSRWAGTLVDRVGPKRPLVAGPLLAAAGFALFMVPSIGGGYWSGVFPAVCVLGLGMAITVAPLTTTVMNAVGAERAGLASGVNNAVSRTAGLVAVAVFGIVMALAFDGELAAQLARLELAPEVLDAVARQHGRLGGIELPPGLDDASRAALQHAIGSAFVTGFRWVMGLCAVLSVASAVSAWWWID